MQKIQFILFHPGISNSKISKIFESRGFNTINIYRKNDSIYIYSYRFKHTERIELCKLFKKLKKNGAQKLLINRENLFHSNNFSKNRNMIVGNGIRSFLELDGCRIKKIFVNSNLEWEREINARKIIPAELGVAPILKSGPYWLEMPFYGNDLRWHPNSIRYYPLDNFDLLFQRVNRFFEMGFCLVDWNYNAFIFTENGLKVVDLEYAYKWTSSEKPTISPDLTGTGHEIDVPRKAVCTFDGVWKSALGVSMDEYTSLPSKRLKRLRFIRLITNRVPKFIAKFLEKCTSRILYRLIYTYEIKLEYIEIQSRIK